MAVDVCNQCPLTIYLCDSTLNLAFEQIDPRVLFKSLARVLCSLITETMGCWHLKTINSIVLRLVNTILMNNRIERN